MKYLPARPVFRCVASSLLLVAAAPSCFAGGFGWEVTVQRMEFKPDGEFLFRVVPEPEALKFPRDCSKTIWPHCDSFLRTVMAEPYSLARSETVWRWMATVSAAHRAAG
jgi:hypothetical protein